MTKDQVLSLEKNRAEIAGECLAYEVRKEAELSYAKSHHMPAGVIKQLEKEFESAKAATLQSLASIDKRLTEARTAFEQEEVRFKADLNATNARMEKGTKYEMYDAWILAGGKPEEFERHWADLYGAEVLRVTKKIRDENKQKTVKEIRSIFANIR